MKAAAQKKTRPKRRPTGPKAKPPPPTIERDAATQVLQGLARRDPGVWFEAYGRVVDKDGDLIRPRLNTLQRRVLAAWDYCQRHGLPCSIIVCKPRQRGSSTIATGLSYHILQSSAVTNRCRIIGGKYKQVSNLWKMLEVYAENDECRWGKGKADVQEKVIRIGTSEFSQETARDPDAGRSGTFRVVIVTELGRWHESGVANAAKVLSGFLACCPRRPGTLRLIESTAQGVGGEFHARYWRAVPLAEFLAGRRSESGYVRVFAGWWEFEESRVTLSPAAAAALEDDLDEEERALRERYDLDLEQLAWRRETIAGEFAGDIDWFRQEYPANEDEAFLSSGRPRFSRAGMDLQETLVAAARGRVRHGDLSLDEAGGVAWQDGDAEGAVLHLYEPSREGLQYLLVVDPMTGESQAMGADPDCHSVLVLRRGYADPNGIWHPPALAMRIRPPRRDYRDACRWDADVLEETIYRMAVYYGAPGATCRIVVEMNKDIGLTELLKRRMGEQGRPSPRLYEREVFNEREQRRTKALGWLTTTANREAIVGHLAAAIRETGEPGAGVEIRCPHALAECRHFERGSRGRSEAAGGWHDDDVMALAIGLATMEHATTYREPRASRTTPAEIRRHEARRKRRPGMYS
jgi:hypothetical protein